MNITIRHEAKSDYDAITYVNDMAFGRANESELIKKLRATKLFIPELSLIAEVGGKLVGHILFYPIKIESKNKTHSPLALAPMSVLPEYQKKGIGGKLIKVGLKKAKDLDFRSVIVLGHADYYPKFEFKPASKWGIYSDFDVPDEVFMALELTGGALMNADGRVIYPKAYLET